MDHTLALHDPTDGKHYQVSIPREIMAQCLVSWCIDTPEKLAQALRGEMPI